MKALIVSNTRNHAPRAHNLSYLAGKSKTEFRERFIDLMAEVTPFNLETRYPEDIEEFKIKCSEDYAKGYTKRCEELREWILSQLK